MTENKFNRIESAKNVEFVKRPNKYPIGAKSWNAVIDEIERLSKIIQDIHAVIHDPKTDFSLTYLKIKNILEGKNNASTAHDKV